MDITVTFPPTPVPMALVRFKEPGRPPSFRSLPLACSPCEAIEEIEAFIIAHLDGPGMWQGWLWEA